MLQISVIVPTWLNAANFSHKSTPASKNRLILFRVYLYSRTSIYVCKSNLAFCFYSYLYIYSASFKALFAHAKSVSYRTSVSDRRGLDQSAGRVGRNSQCGLGWVGLGMFLLSRGLGWFEFVLKLTETEDQRVQLIVT